MSKFFILSFLRRSILSFVLCGLLFAVSTEANARTVRLGVYNFMPLIGVGKDNEGLILSIGPATRAKAEHGFYMIRSVYQFNTRF
jgi:hypothetical protein